MEVSRKSIGGIKRFSSKIHGQNKAIAAGASEQVKNDIGQVQRDVCLRGVRGLKFGRG